MCSSANGSKGRIVTWDPLSQDGVLPGFEGGSVLAIGVFDGLHLGHRTLVSAAGRCAHEKGLPLAVTTFDLDPDELFVPDTHVKLCSNAARVQMLADFAGCDVVVLPSNREVFSIAPQEFLDRMGASLRPACVHVGSDFRFGSCAAGTVADIRAWGEERGCACEPHDLVVHGVDVVTSTRIRGLIGRGRVAEARELLGGRAHMVEGAVVHGRGEGAGFGFATANLDLTRNEAMLPLEGVYGGYVVVRGARYAAAINMGKAASFENATAPIEAHLLGFSGDMYGEDVQVEFVEWLRGQRVFQDEAELVSTVMDNIAWVRDNLGGGAVGQDR